MENLTEIISARLIQLRGIYNFTQKDISRRIGISQSYISHIENKDKLPTLETLQKIANAFGLEVYQLLITMKGR